MSNMEIYDSFRVTPKEAKGKAKRYLFREHAERFSKYVNKGSECWLWTGFRDKDGYGRFQCGKRAVGAHRVSFEIYKGEIPEKAIVLHRCDNPACVNPDHLFIGSQADNIQDCMAKGRRKVMRGDQHYNAKLSSEQVLGIRRQWSNGELSAVLEQAYGVTQQTISDIVNYRSWRHI